MTRYAFTLAILAGDSCAPWWVWDRLTVYTGNVRSTHHLSLIPRDTEEARTWAHDRSDVSVMYEPPGYGRYAETRWALRVASVADGVVIFGDAGRWWRLLGYCRAAGVKVKVCRVVPPGVPAPISAPGVWVSRP